MKHHNKTRKIVIIICGSIVIIQIGMFLYANFATLPEYVSWKIMGFPVDWINDINEYLHLGTLIVALVFAIPFFILRSEKAIKEFNN